MDNKFNPDQEYLVVNQRPSDEFRNLLSYTPSSGSMADVRNVIIQSAVEGKVKRGFHTQGLSGHEYHEWVDDWIQGQHIAFKLIHTKQLAPDGVKTVCFLSTVTPYKRRPSKKPIARTLIEKAAAQAVKAEGRE